ncbi:RNA polymerase sigma factor [Tessaracoccus flavus]|uniref:Uncharacterized protein n=1 Tax=Tessaracoccus flavus TaxID=1610493 RepID=A0A1Q2CIW7_9ACTN|nr:sigma-70 family RNA polymerase sigma factor [Tessaracoccus flavus]AQP46057.1 hypothetical protein RPIT_06475 [Tessaracoccus flavus]SDY71330.1 RNA polymerase sigma factor, sigma-70 family [Tessaracoccus flavus]
MSAPATSSLSGQAAAAFAAYRSGETGRMSELVSLLTPALWAVARSAGLDSAKAEDVVQSAWEALVRKADTIDDPQAVFAWLLTTTRRAAWRAAGARREEPLVEDSPAPTPTPETIVLDEDRGLRLWRHVKALSPRCQALIRVIAFAPTPDYAAISAALGMPVGSIGPTRGRCLAALRAALADDPAWSLS